MSFRTIWLGWGPGGRGEFEEEWYQSNQNLNVWKQPVLPQKLPNACQTFFDHGHAFLNQQLQAAVERKEKTHLIVHSFGFQVLLAWLRNKPSMPFDKVSVLSGTFNPFSPYANLSHHYQLKPFSKVTPNPEAFLETIQNLTGHANLMKSYWADPNSDVAHRYFALQNKIPHLDFETFINVNLSLIQQVQEKKIDVNHPLAEANPFPIEVYLGTLDPLLNVDEEQQLWKKYFPLHRMHLFRCGHFPHFEVPTLQIFNDKLA